MHNNRQITILIAVLISLISQISLIFIVKELNDKPSQVIDYRPTYIYNVTINNTIPPVKTKPEHKQKEKVKVESKPKAKVKPKTEPKQEHKQEALSGDTYLLAHIINAEARDQPYEGKLAVGNVIMNRVKSSEFPNTIKDVIYQEGQFSPVSDGSINREPSEDAIKAAKEVMNGRRVLGNDILYFYNPKTSTNKWVFSREVTTQIGNHAFAK